MFSRDVFVPNGPSRKDTAIVLVGTADEFDIDQRSIKATAGGFYITNELARYVYDEDELEQPVPEPEPKPKTTRKSTSAKKTSGNRAAKTVTEKE